MLTSLSVYRYRPRSAENPDSRIKEAEKATKGKKREGAVGTASAFCYIGFNSLGGAENRNSR